MFTAAKTIKDAFVMKLAVFGDTKHKNASQVHLIVSLLQEPCTKIYVSNDVKNDVKHEVKFRLENPALPNAAGLDSKALSALASFSALQPTAASALTTSPALVSLTGNIIHMDLKNKTRILITDNEAEYKQLNQSLLQDEKHIYTPNYNQHLRVILCHHQGKQELRTHAVERLWDQVYSAYYSKSQEELANKMQERRGSLTEVPLTSPRGLDKKS